MEEICISILKMQFNFYYPEISEQFLRYCNAATAGLPVPFAPVHLLFINLLTDSLPAIALGMEPHSKAVMDQKPRPVNESILTKAYLVNIEPKVCASGL